MLPELSESKNEKFLKAKYPLAFFSAFLLELWFDAAAYSANNSAYVLGVFVSITYPMIAMVPVLLIVDEKSIRDKLKIALLEGFGYATATIAFFVVRDW